MKQLIFLAGFLLFGLTMEFHAAEPSPEVLREVAEFDVSWKKALPPDDPRFGIVRVLSLLNLDYPGLQKVKAATEAKHYKEAETELLAYFRSTRAAKNEPNRKVGATQRLHADDALRHYFRGNRDTFPPVFRGAHIDWTGRAFVDGKEIHDNEWYFQFHRLTWWPALAASYAATGDERYFREWRFEMVCWSEEMLPFTRNTPYFVKRGMETYDRCDRMIQVLPQMIRSQDFDAKTLLYFLASFHDQADHIPTVYAKKGNHRLGELMHVFRNGVSFPEFKRAEAWKNDAIVLLPKMMADDIYDDGMNKELVFSYHGMYVGLFLDAWRMFREHGYEKSLPPSFYPKILKMAEIYALQTFPDFTLCQFGDAWKNRNSGSLFRGDLAAVKDDIPYYEYMVSNGHQGKPPGKTNACYPQSGFYFFRSEWSPDAVFMPLKCGATAAWHNQPDNGTFELFAYGRNLMTDSGCYVYGSSDKEDQNWRKWFRSTKVHQTLTLDNQTSACAPTCVLWSDSPSLTTLVVENQSYPGLKHRRIVLFIERNYFIIHDEAIGAAAGNVRVHFQFAPGAAALEGFSARTLHTQGANLLVKTFPLVENIEMEKEDGWISYEIRRKESRPAWSWKIAKNASTPQVGFLTALIPYRKGNAPSNVEASVSPKGNQRVFRIKNGETTCHVLVDLTAKTALVR